MILRSILKMSCQDLSLSSYFGCSVCATRVMLLANKHSIREVILFPHLREMEEE
jgi:hypothetical protein